MPERLRFPPLHKGTSDPGVVRFSQQLHPYGTPETGSLSRTHLSNIAAIVLHQCCTGAASNSRNGAACVTGLRVDGSAEEYGAP